MKTTLASKMGQIANELNSFTSTLSFLTKCKEILAIFLTIGFELEARVHVARSKFVINVSIFYV